MHHCQAIPHVRQAGPRRLALDIEAVAVVGPTASWLKELIEHPAQVLSFDDARHWSERSFVALCMQTTDTSIELIQPISGQTGEEKDDARGQREGRGEGHCPARVVRGAR